MSRSFQGQTGKKGYHDRMSSLELFQFLFQTYLHLKEPELQSGGMYTIFLDSRITSIYINLPYAGEPYLII